jgi:hypothetical protein
MDDVEEIPGVYVDLTNNTCPEPSPGKMERGITPLEKSVAFKPPVFPA